MRQVPRLPERGEDVLTWAQAITKFIQSLIGQESADIYPQVGPQGTRWLLRRKPPVPTVDPSPFMVGIANVNYDGDTVSSIDLSVNDQSWVMKSMKWDDNQEITGLTDDLTEVQSTDKVWLDMEVDEDRSITAITVKSGVPADHDWDTFPDPVKYDDPDSPDRKQTHWFQLLAYIDEYDDAPPRNGTVLPFDEGKKLLIQCTFTHLIACERCDERGGEILKVLMPWYAPYLGPLPDDGPGDGP